MPRSHRVGVDMFSTFGYVYTSGTTGLPKVPPTLTKRLLGPCDPGLPLVAPQFILSNCVEYFS